MDVREPPDTADDLHEVPSESDLISEGDEESS